MASVPLAVGDGSVPLASVGVHPSISPALTPEYLYRWATEEGDYEGPYQLLDNVTAIIAALLALATLHSVHIFYSVVPGDQQGLDMIAEWASNIEPPPEHLLLFRIVKICPQMPTSLFFKRQCVQVLNLPGFMTPEMGQILPYSRRLERRL